MSGQPGKRRAMLAGALKVFARDGFTRASIDTMAAEAGVSTRTIYNHFGSKAGLFHEVMLENATRVAEAQIAIVERHLAKVTDLEADLIAFGRDLAAPMTEYADHFTLVRQVNAEAAHIPKQAIDAWQEAGPLRVRRALGERLCQLADRGLLRVGNPERAAMHLMLLVLAWNPSFRPARPETEAELEEMVTSGVHAFLHGYS
ncbi:TetR/AcrR family transcriptional regulator [Flindersiella endophytica]